MKWFNHLSIKARLIGSFALLLLMLAAVIVTAWLNGQHTQNTVRHIVESEMVKFEIVAQIDSLTKNNARNTLELFVVSPEERPPIRARMGQIRTALDDLFARLEPMLLKPEGKTLFAEMKTRRLAYVAAFTATADLLANDPDQALVMLNTRVLPAIDALAEPVDQLKAFQLNLANEAGANLIRQVERQNWLNIGIGVVAVALVLLLASMLIASIMRPLRHAMAVAATVGKGDLTMAIQADGDHELTRLLESMKGMQSHLSLVILRMQESAAQVAAASSQIAAANLDLSARTEAQASSLEETAASMEEMTASVQQNQQMTDTANRLAMTAATQAQDAGRLMDEVVGMIRDMHGSSQRINDIIGVIDSIAFQTNILALNAAVEAARAGEQGRGFAVVASEVRALAKRSAEAAQEIKGIIQNNVQKMAQGSTLAEKAGGAVGSVVEAIGRVNTTVGDVAVATREQSDGIDQIGQAVMQLDQATQQNAALVEETSAATSNLDDQVQALKQQISGFRITESQSTYVLEETRPVQRRLK